MVPTLVENFFGNAIIRSGKFDCLFLTQKKIRTPMWVGDHFSLFIMKGNASIQAVYCYKGELKAF